MTENSDRSVRRRMTVVLVLSGILFSVLMTTMLPLLPVLPAQLDASPEGVSWLVTSTMLVGAVSTPVFGRLADMYGRRTILLGVLSVMSVGAALCAVTDTLWPLILGRALQGVGAAVVPIAMSVFRDVLPPDELNASVGMMSTTVGIGAALGLPLTTVVAQFGDWHLLFALIASLAVGAVVLVYRYVPETGARTGGRFDGQGAVMLTILLVALLVGISQGNSLGWLSWQVLGHFAFALAMLPVFVSRQRRAADPVLDLTFFTRPPVLLANLAALVIGFAFFANGFIVSQELLAPKGAGLALSLIGSGVAQSVNGAAMIVIPPVAARVATRFSARVAAVLGSVFLICGYLLHLAPGSSLVVVIAAMSVVSTGTGFCYSALPLLVMESVRREQTGAANGVNVLVRMLGQTLGAAVATAVLTVSMSTYTGVISPTADAFRWAYLTALVASVAALAVSWVLPRVPRPPSAA